MGPPLGAAGVAPPPASAPAGPWSLGPPFTCFRAPVRVLPARETGLPPPGRAPRPADPLPERTAGPKSLSGFRPSKPSHLPAAPPPARPLDLPESCGRLAHRRMTPAGKVHTPRRRLLPQVLCPALLYSGSLPRGARIGGEDPEP